MIRSILLAATLAFALGTVPGKDGRAADNAHENYVEKIPDSDASFEMIAVPGGTFTMGSPENEPGRAENEGPQFQAEIKPFWMGKYEITWDEFQPFLDEMGVEDRDENKRRRMDKADALTGPTPPYVPKYYGHGDQGHPAICMTHHCAWEYCRWLSSKTGKQYRLPTEAEWEYAARAGSKTAFSFGDDPAKLVEFGWFAKNSPDLERKPNKLKGTTHKVGSLKPNPFGLYDMYGNVMEWTLDHYDDKAYEKYAKMPQPVSRPVTLAPGRKWSHVARGGSWADKAEACRSAARRVSELDWMQHDPQEPQSIWWLTKFDVVGFRVVRAVDEQDNLKGYRSKVVEDTGE